MTELVIGTKNKSKLKEIKEIYADLPFNCLDLGAFQGVSEVVEDGSSFAENAAKKLRGMPCRWANGFWLKIVDWSFLFLMATPVFILHAMRENMAVMLPTTVSFCMN